MMRSSLRPDLHRLQVLLDSLPDRAVVIDNQGDAWQHSRYLGYWYRAFDGEGLPSFHAAQVMGAVDVIRGGS